MNAEQRAELIALFEDHAKSIGAVRDWCNTLEATLNAIKARVFADAIDEVDARVLFASPVTGRVGDVWGMTDGIGWFVATAFKELYEPTPGKKAYHPSVDLNLAGFKDSGKPVYAAADGDVVFSGVAAGWQGKMVVIRHHLEDGSIIWTRYAHLRDTIQIGQTVVPIKRGSVIGHIGDYTPVGGPRGDHVDYGGAKIDLGAHPEDWPGMDLGRLVRDYIDMTQFHRERSK